MQNGWVSRRDDDGYLWVEIDHPHRAVNTLSRSMLEGLNSLIDQIESSKPKGVLFVSAKKGNFIAGADIEEMTTLRGPEEARQLSEFGQRVFARLESLKVPTVALISGSCLGGGLEFSLCCTHRVADDSRKTLLGLPEVQLGLVPGWGGTVRLPRRVGLLRALKMITTGSPINGRQAYSAGLVDAVVPPEALQPVGLQLLSKPAKPRKRSIWQRLFVENNPGRALVFQQARKQVLKRTHGKYPAPMKALEVLQEGLGSKSAGFAAESAAIAELSTDAVTRESIRLFFLKENAKRWAEQVAPGASEATIHQLGLLGAGTMGAGMAVLFADRGIEVRLRDLSLQQLASGMKSARTLLDGQVKRKRSTRHEADAAYRRISPTVQLSGLKNAQIVIEAVVEKMEVKKHVLRELLEVIGPETVLATNTSSLTVSEMSEALDDPGRLVGVHFFNPPAKMPLVEIVRTLQTSDHALQTAVALVRQIGKTPIIVNDCPGFLVNRLLVPYLNEAGYLLTEGVPPEKLEEAAIEFGFPMGPLELTDLIGATVATKVGQQMYHAYGERMKPAPAWNAYSQWANVQPLGKPTTFYIKSRSLRQKFNPALHKLFERVHSEHPDVRSQDLSHEEIAQRLVFPLIDEAARCLEEKIVEKPDAIDLAMVFGTGFAPFRGGPLRYANSIGVANVVAALERWNRDRPWGRDRPRTAPSDALRSYATSGFPLEDSFGALQPVSAEASAT